MENLFDLTGKVAVITGGAGFLGRKHAEAIARHGGIPVLLDLQGTGVDACADALRRVFPVDAWGCVADITQEDEVADTCAKVLEKFGRIDVLINNAANNPKVDADSRMHNASRLENFPLLTWDRDVAVGLTGSFLCAKYFGGDMAKKQRGSIINISSDLGIIGPNQSLYEQEGVREDMQNVKPVTYSVVKTGIIGLTRYIATYWADKGVRCNALCPGGVLNNQGEEFLSRIRRLIPMGRMAEADELQGSIVFLASDASSYMTGTVLIIDGGRTCW
jgi:NAD(P)-dependent dehydrogenase (short-subunit alcohol dehydrogenase family)